MTVKAVCSSLVTGSPLPVGVLLTLAELPELVLISSVFLLGALFGVAGKIIFHRESESFVAAAFIGSTMGLLGILGAELVETKLSVRAAVGVSLFVAMLGGEGAEIIRDRFIDKMRGDKDKK